MYVSGDLFFQMNKSILILLVVSTLLLVDGQVTINNRMANSLLRDIDLECPLFGARPGASVTRGQVMRAFTFSDGGFTAACH